MEELQKIIEDLRDRQHELEIESEEIYRKLDEAENKLAVEQLKVIDHTIPYYTKKLERLKKFVEMFQEESRGTSIHYAFDKQEDPYKGDFHEVIQDPLDYLIGEYDCLGMTKFLEIVFEYHNDAVKRFVEDWMKKNLPDVELYQKSGSLYNRHFSKKDKNGNL